MFNLRSRHQPQECPDGIRLNREATITETLKPGLYRVKYEGSYWKAIGPELIHFSPGDTVRVVKLIGIDLQVEPQCG